MFRYSNSGVVVSVPIDDDQINEVLNKIIAPYTQTQKFLSGVITSKNQILSIDELKDDAKIKGHCYLLAVNTQSGLCQKVINLFQSNRIKAEIKNNKYICVHHTIHLLKTLSTTFNVLSYEYLPTVMTSQEPTVITSPLQEQAAAMLLAFENLSISKRNDATKPSVSSVKDDYSFLFSLATDKKEETSFLTGTPNQTIAVNPNNNVDEKGSAPFSFSPIKETSTSGYGKSNRSRKPARHFVGNNSQSFLTFSVATEKPNITVSAQSDDKMKVDESEIEFKLVYMDDEDDTAQSSTHNHFTKSFF